jgi:hypothetical protein
MVSGEVEPAMGALESATGIRLLTASCMINVDWVQSFKGLMANDVMIELKETGDKRFLT